MVEVFGHGRLDLFKAVLRYLRGDIVSRQVHFQGAHRHWEICGIEFLGK